MMTSTLNMRRVTIAAMIFGGDSAQTQKAAARSRDTAGAATSRAPAVQRKRASELIDTAPGLDAEVGRVLRTLALPHSAGDAIARSSADSPGISRIRRMEQPGEGTHIPAIGAGVRVQRLSNLEAVDKAAEDKRMSHARDAYLFEKSLQSSDDASAATNERLAEQRETVTSENDVGALSPVFLFLYKRNPALAISQFGYTAKQAATIQARLKETNAIPKPDELLPAAQIAAHLGKFAKGAHAFIDPTASKKIENEITDERFKGWGIDANFVAPLDEANALNAKAHKERGIETIEDELGIPSKYWSKSAWNPGKELVRWVIPKPKLSVDEEGVGVMLEMATGRETGADPRLWVAGGLTKGGASEAVLKAIPREQLMKHLADGQIKQKIETYPETRDNIT